MYNNKVSKITSTLVSIMFYGGILACFLTPWITKFYSYRGREYIYLAVSVFVSGLVSVYIMYQLKQIFKTITAGDPFVSANVLSLKRIAVASFIIAIVYIAKLILLFTPATFVIVIIFITAGLFCLTLMNVFAKAIEFKEENALTV